MSNALFQKPEPPLAIAPTILTGDYNVMPTDLDVYKPERWVDDALFRPEVRAAFQKLTAQGWTDALRNSSVVPVLSTANQRDRPGKPLIISVIRSLAVATLRAAKNPSRLVLLILPIYSSRKSLTDLNDTTTYGQSRSTVAEFTQRADVSAVPTLRHKKPMDASLGGGFALDGVQR